MWTFRAMNTEVNVAAPAVDEGSAGAFACRTARIFAEVERRFSRFLPDSELSILNHSVDELEVSAEMLEVLLAARRHVLASEGLFDPAIGTALRAAGYDRSFSPGALDHALASAAPRRTRFAELEIDEARARVRRPPGLQLDFGGFLKGRTIDRAVVDAPALAMLEAGGDAVVRGAGPDGRGWLVEIEDPSDPRRVIAELRLRDRAVATSAPNRRHWRAGQELAHHLIDPRTGRPSASDLAQVTVVAPTAEEADVLATVTFLRGAHEGACWLESRPGVGGVLIGRDGALRLVGDVEVAGA